MSEDIYLVFLSDYDGTELYDVLSLEALRKNIKKFAESENSKHWFACYDVVKTKLDDYYNSVGVYPRDILKTE